MKIDYIITYVQSYAAVSAENTLIIIKLHITSRLQCKQKSEKDF
jgi:hypothetical protein